MIVQTEGDLVPPQRGSVTSVIWSVSLGMWNGSEIIFHRYCGVIQNMGKILSTHSTLVDSPK